jgi:peroxiredoxin
VVVDGVVKALNVEPDGTGYTVSGPEKLLTQVRRESFRNSD